MLSTEEKKEIFIINATFTPPFNARIYLSSSQTTQSNKSLLLQPNPPVFYDNSSLQPTCTLSLSLCHWDSVPSPSLFLPKSRSEQALRSPIPYDSVYYIISTHQVDDDNSSMIFKPALRRHNFSLLGSTMAFSTEAPLSWSVYDINSRCHIILLSDIYTPATHSRSSFGRPPLSPQASRRRRPDRPPPVECPHSKHVRPARARPRRLIFRP